MFGSSQPEIKLLKDEGILSRPIIPVDGGEVGNIIWQCHVDAFLMHEKQEPGCWCLSEGPNSLLRNDRNFLQNRGALIELTRAIPIPTRDAPMQEILEFKQKRRDEIYDLYSEIENLFTSVISSPDIEFELTRCIQNIEKSCAAVLDVSKESKIPFELSTQGINFSFDLSKIGSRAIAGFAIGSFLELGSLAAIVGGLSAISINIDANLNFRRRKQIDSPFRFVGSLHREFL